MLQEDLRQLIFTCFLGIIQGVMDGRMVVQGREECEGVHLPEGAQQVMF